MRLPIHRVMTLTAGVSIMLLSMVGCTSSLPTAVTCDGIRALQLGMTTDEVERQIGPSRTWAPGPDVNRPETVEVWGYHSESAFGGIRMNVRFDKGRLFDVDAYAKYLWNQRDTPLFRLVGTRREEDLEFGRYFSCGN